ncbi:MAG: 2-C-methyl-D-erythritol 2,4-cyclodiphosphate synthase, partial [Parachlamydiales bacterium]|nr:2-C-methyl-D-erythritol 2,4-cyclodiphosphate synthase [Parachlamydiales bacterium]
KFRVGIGQDSHRFSHTKKGCVLGGIILPDAAAFEADSDGDVILHALCNAISSLSGVSILGDVAITLCRQGIRDSNIYLQEALKTLQSTIVHVAFTIEGKRPRLENRIVAIRKNIAALLHISMEQVGLTVTSGDELTSFGRGEGMQCLCLLTAYDQ